MEAKEKAEELFNKFSNVALLDSYEAKECTLLLVDEITSIKLLWYQKDTKELDYWQEVKNEINKL